MATETQSQQDRPSKWKRFAGRFGLALLIFYTVKGLLWLIVPAAIAWWAMRDSGTG